MHKSLIFTEAGITIRALQGFTTKTKTLREKRKSRKGQKKGKEDTHTSALVAKHGRGERRTSQLFEKSRLLNVVR